MCTCLQNPLLQNTGKAPSNSSPFFASKKQNSNKTNRLVVSTFKLPKARLSSRMNFIRPTQKYHRLDSFLAHFFIDIGTQICALTAFSRTRQTTWCAKSLRHHCSHPHASAFNCTPHYPDSGASCYRLASCAHHYSCGDSYAHIPIHRIPRCVPGSARRLRRRHGNAQNRLD